MHWKITALWGGKKVELRETQRAVTPFGGLVVFFEFLRRIGFCETVRQHLPFSLPSPNAIIGDAVKVSTGCPFTRKTSTMAQKTNAARFLDQMGISYELREYEVGPDDLGAEAVATKIGLPAAELFKTLVAQGDRHGICMAVIPSDAELDLKTIAAASDNRKIHLVPVKELQKLTGYVRGGVTAIAAKKAFPVYVDNSIERFELISVSAGVRGLQILLAPADYLRIVNARVAAIALSRSRAA